MWKFVSRRVKDSIELGINVRKSFACHQNLNSQNPQKQQQKQPQKYDPIASFSLIPQPKGPESKKKDEDFKRKFNHNPRCNPLLHALTWSTALITGFYASQLLCLYRRNQRLALEGSRCYHSKYFFKTGHNINNRVRYLLAPGVNQQSSLLPSLPKCPFSSGRKREVKKKKKPEDEFKDFQYGNFFSGTPGLFDKRFEKSYESDASNSSTNNVYNNSTNNVYNISNDKTETFVQNEPKEEKFVQLKQEVTAPTANESTKEFTEKEKEQVIDDAIRNLSEIVGELEFQMGVDDIMSGEFQTAADHFKLSTTHNHPGGIFNLALCYEQGLGVRKNMKTAMKLYELAFSLGHPSAGFNLGVFYVHGIGGATKSFEAARKCFEKAAELGNVDAMEALVQLLPAPKAKKLPLFDEPEDFIMKESPMISSAISAFTNNLRRIAVN